MSSGHYASLRLAKQCFSSQNIDSPTNPVRFRDEFGILNIETTLENTQKLVNRLLKSLQNAGINAALGVAAREPSKNLRMAVIEADEKMYQHKRQLKSSFDDSIEQDV
ncbi:hypothetical protein [Acinetobacter sp. TUM15064]|uniref:hypothetical protein n=1 Tax=Acinetobacter sp. TUM15064 TaxID=2609134 RepID=UPI001D193727|nr:hypothetical protein [Acinetobacter sp. TUM15064]